MLHHSHKILYICISKVILKKSQVWFGFEADVFGALSRLLSPSYDMAAALQTSLARANYEKDFASRWSINLVASKVIILGLSMESILDFPGINIVFCGINIVFLWNQYWISVESILYFCGIKIDNFHWQGAGRYSGNNSLGSRLNCRL